MPRVGAIVLNFNGLAETRVALRSLLAVQGVDLVPTIIDNGSAADEAALLRAEFPGIDVERLPVNVGFSRGVNHAARRALHAGATHLLLLNSDAWFEDGALVLRELLRAMDADCSLAAVGPAIRNADGTLQSAGYAYSPWWPLSRPHKRASTRPGFISGSCMLIDAARFAELGGFDPDFFLYGEDVDFALRARARGWSFATVPHVAARHVRATSSSLYSQRYVYTVLRGNLIAARKHTAWYQWPSAAFAFFLASGGLVVLAWRAGNRRAALAVGKAWVDFARGRWGGLHGETLTPSARPGTADLLVPAA